MPANAFRVRRKVRTTSMPRSIWSTGMVCDMSELDGGSLPSADQNSETTAASWVPSASTSASALAGRYLLVATRGHNAA